MKGNTSPDQPGELPHEEQSRLAQGVAKQQPIPVRTIGLGIVADLEYGATPMICFELPDGTITPAYRIPLADAVEVGNNLLKLAKVCADLPPPPKD